MVSVLLSLIWPVAGSAIATRGCRKADSLGPCFCVIDLAWWLDLVFTKLHTVRATTRSLVHVLDSREFAKDTYDFASDRNERTLQQSFKRALTWLPQVNSILLDGHTDIDPSFLNGSASTDSTTCPLLLSIPYCPYQLPNPFFSSPPLQKLVYLDISGVPGSIAPLIQPAVLPDLRVLKIRHREIDNATLAALASMLGLRLWSLDLSNNKLSDDVIETLRQKCFPVTQLRSGNFFTVEGRLSVSEMGTRQNGAFLRVEESEWSGRFNHPERYFVDAPIYLAKATDNPQEHHPVRSPGSRLIRQDTADVISEVLSEGDMAIEDLRISHGLTHVHLSNNNVSSVGLEKLVKTTNGQIEKLSCDSMPLLPESSGYPQLWPGAAKLCGILGAAHIFRPVYSSNLGDLRIHHSLVTHIPTLDFEGASALSQLYIAESAILPRVDEAFPQTFIPDMNPRLESLTLTCVPRRSLGPLITRLISFLKCLSEQERAIQDVSLVASSRRGPGILKGLRHLRFEFEPDPMADGFTGSEDLDAEELLNSGEQGFSFFGNEWTGKVAAVAETGSGSRGVANSSPEDTKGKGDEDTPNSDRIDEEFLTYHGKWNDQEFSIPVWVGKTSAMSCTLKEYRRLAVEQNVRDNVGPATPAQLLAGAPSDSYVFQTAWTLAIMPKEIEAPTTTELAGMKDVLEELKRYRLDCRAKYTDLKRGSKHQPTPLGEPHYFWTGYLEVAMEEPASHARPSQYWR